MNKIIRQRNVTSAPAAAVIPANFGIDASQQKKGLPTLHATSKYGEERGIKNNNIFKQALNKRGNTITIKREVETE